MSTTPTPQPLPSERIVIQAPMSFTGSAKHVRRAFTNDTVFWLVGVPLLVTWWTLILCWYVMFGILLVPYRILRRGQRRRALDEARHRELLAAAQHQVPRDSA